MEKREKDNRIWYSSNIINLCMDSYDAEKQCGRLYHQYAGGSIAFQSFLEAFNRMEELYDRLQFPQASTQYRSFLTDRRAGRWERKADSRRDRIPEDQRREIREVNSFKEVIEQRGERATFVIRVQYRQHSSWQGEITWIDGQKKEYFRSALELLRLMDSVLGTEDLKTEACAEGSD